MSGQTFRENIEQDVHYVVHKADGDTDDLINDLVNWAVERFQESGCCRSCDGHACDDLH